MKKCASEESKKRKGFHGSRVHQWRNLSDRYLLFLIFYLLRRKERGNRSRDQILSTNVGVAQLCQVKDFSIYTQTFVPIGWLDLGSPHLIGHRGSSAAGWVSKRQERISHNTRDERQGNSCSCLHQPFTLSLLELLPGFGHLVQTFMHTYCIESLLHVSPESWRDNACQHILLK